MNIEKREGLLKIMSDTVGYIMQLEQDCEDYNVELNESIYKSCYSIVESVIKENKNDLILFYNMMEIFEKRNIRKEIFYLYNIHLILNEGIKDFYWLISEKYVNIIDANDDMGKIKSMIKFNTLLENVDTFYRVNIEENTIKKFQPII